MAAAVLAAPPTTTKYSFKQGDTHVGVWAIQRFLNGIGYANYEATGFFGELTDDSVKRYQSAVGIEADGIVGPQTQARMVRSCVTRAPHGSDLPRGLTEGVIDGESGGLLAAVNTSVPGGVDCGLTQRRVYEPYDPDKVAEAFDPAFNVSFSVGELYGRYKTFRIMPAVTKRSDATEYAWRLAALAHNWPWGANELANGRALSTWREATWVPSTVKFPDGSDVFSYSDWAKYYAMGSKSKQWAGLVTGMAFDIPASG